MTLHVELVSPEALVWSGDVDSVLLRTVGGGDIQFLTGHTPVLAALDICSVEMKRTDGLLEKVAVRGGFVEVSNDRVKILSDQGVLAEEVDPNAVRGQLTEAEAALARVQDELERKKAEDDLKWHAAQLRAAGAE